MLPRPELIDMDVIVPDLCATDHYLNVAELCLLKMEKLREIASLDTIKIIECQNIITGLVSALNQSITE